MLRSKHGLSIKKPWDINNSHVMKTSG